jgi:IS4 transposase
MLMVFEERIVNKITFLNERKEEIERLKKLIESNVTFISYLTLSAVSVQFFCLLFSCWYSSSINDRNAVESDSFRNVYKDANRNKIPLEEKRKLD